MNVSSRQNSGFTIVELLIVIVVIAILAAITIVSFAGVSNRANDAAIRSDLRNLAQAIEHYRIDNGALPTPAGIGEIAGFDKFAPTKKAYDTSINNLYLCTATIDGQEQYALVAASTSGKRLTYTSQGGQGEHSGAWSINGGVCTGAGISTSATNFKYAFGYFLGSNRWTNWIK